MRLRAWRWLLVSVGGIAPLAYAGCGLQLGPVPVGGGSGGASGIDAGLGAGGDAGTTSTGTTTGMGGAGVGVASACTDDGDCGPSLSCAKDSSNDPIFGGGPPGGFCTKPCSVDTDCPAPDGVCLLVDGQSGRCTLACAIGEPIQSSADLLEPLDPTKCLGREDLRCTKAKGGGGGVCLPTCGSDSQCDGRACDPRLAVCVDQPPTGLPVGAACTPNMEPSGCAGTCIGFDSGESICSSPCVLGGTVDALDCGGLAAGFCAFGPDSSGVGDVGYCTPACHAQADCQNPSFWCFTVDEVSAKSNAGYCFAAKPCPGGQADCDAQWTCTTTAQGAFCLDTAYALPPSGTGGAGGGP